MIKTIICIATIFGFPGDKYGGRSPTVLYGRPVLPSDMGLALRSRKTLGKYFRVTNLRTKKSAIGRQIDTGPWGKLDNDGRWFNGAPRFRERNRGRVGKWRGCADLTPALAKSIGHDGRERIKLELLKGRR